MSWCVIRHPDLPAGDGRLAVATIAADALPAHEATGWERVSDWADTRDELRPADYATPPTPPEPARPRSRRTAREEQQQ